jgi:hypothetical protein
MSLLDDYINTFGEGTIYSATNVDFVLQYLDKLHEIITNAIPEPIKISDGADLNDYKTPGYYAKESSAPANSYLFFLEVLRNNNRLVQILCSSYNGSEWIRSAYVNERSINFNEWGNKQQWSLENIYPKTVVIMATG